MAVSYDSPAILKDFANRHKIEFPLVADPESKIISSFRVFNSQATGMTKGMAHPGFYFIDAAGVIREKYFETNYTDRFTANNVIGKLFPELTEEVRRDVDAPHLKLTLEQSDATATLGSRVTLTAEVELPAGVHVYAPGVTGYKPIQLMLQPTAEVEAAPAVFPKPISLFLPAIKETVPVFEGKFRISQDVTVNIPKGPNGAPALPTSEKTLSIAGELKYQACDATVCYPPTSVPVKWDLRVQPLDLQRSPEDIRHK